MFVSKAQTPQNTEFSWREEGEKRGSKEARTFSLCEASTFCGAFGGGDTFHHFLSEREACNFVETQRSSLGGSDSLVVSDSGLVDCLAHPGPGDELARLADAAARPAAAARRHRDRSHRRVEPQ